MQENNKFSYDSPTTKPNDDGNFFCESTDYTSKKKIYKDVSASKFLFVDGLDSEEEITLRSGSEDHKMTDPTQGRDKINDF